MGQLPVYILPGFHVVFFLHGNYISFRRFPAWWRILYLKLPFQMNQETLFKKENHQLIRWIIGLLSLTVTGFYVAFNIFSSSVIVEKNRSFTQDNDATNRQEYFRWRNDGSCHLYFEFGGHVYRTGNESENIITGVDGQKAVCLDPGLAPSSGTCVVYSFGLSDDWSFDAAMAAYGCDVFSFDPSIQQLQMPNKTQRIHYFNMGLGTINTKKNPRGWRITTLASIRKYLLHSYRPIDYLKIDIEGDEWPVLEQFLQDEHSFRDVKQIGMEVHLLPLDRLDYYRKLIERLESSGYVRFFSRQNRWMTNAYELAWFNANYSLNQSLSTLLSGWKKDESLFNNKLPLIV